jgi:signal transduction histidine kinase/tetratricopeptide (TPR) repeat protein
MPFFPYSQTLAQAQKAIRNHKSLIISLLLTVVFLLPLWGLGGFAFAQEKAKIDSLLKVVKTTKEDTNKVNTLQELALRYNRLREWDNVLKYGQTSLTLAQKLQFPKGIAEGYRFLGITYTNKGDNKKALGNYTQALKIAETLPNQEPLANAYLSLGQYYETTGKLGKGLEYYLKSLQIVEKLKNPTLTGKLYRALGNYYVSVGDYPRALDYQLKALKIAEKLNELPQIYNSHISLGTIYSSLLDYAQAKFHYLKSMDYVDVGNSAGKAQAYNNLADLYIRQKASHPDSIAQAVRYIDQALTLADKKDKFSYIAYIISKGEIYFLQKNYAEALKILLASLKLSEEIESLGDYSYIYNVIADIYSERGDNAQALTSYQKALQTNVGTMEDLLHTYEGLLRMYNLQQDYKNAFQYQTKYHHLKDSLFSAETQLKAEAAQVNFALEKQNDKIALLEKDKTLQAAQNQRTTVFLILALILVGGVVVFAVYLGRLNQQQKKTNRQLQEKNEEVAQQAEELHQQAEELAAQRDSLEKANENVMLLSEIGKEITATLDVKTIIETAYEKVNALMDATVFMVGVFNAEKQQIEMPIIKEKGETHPFLTYHLSETERPAIWCFTNQKELVWNDVYNDYPQYFNGKTLPPVKSGDQTNSIIYLPLLSNDRAIGVISVQSFQKDAYNDYQVHMLRNIAIYTAIAVKNAENLQALDEEKKNLEGKNQELEALTEELRQQSDMVELQRDQLAESSTQLEELLEESQSQKEILEIRNQEMEALQSTKDLMISAVNHDLRNPLNPILNYSQADYPKFTEKERLAMIHDRAKMMFALINDIMDVYRADKMQLQPQTASLYKAVNEAITAISEAKTDLPEIINEVPENAQAIFEFKYIERVFENLLSNAVKYSENKSNGGKIRFYTEAISDEQGKKYYRIAIQDNGMGIPKEKFEEIFLPFSNPNAKDIGAAKSVGIGLTFCKTIVEAHHSQILIESEVGKGTTFAFDLPMVEEFLAHSTDNQSNGEFELNETDKAYLAEFVPQLAVFQDELFNADVRKVLKNIEAKDSESIRVWKLHLEQSIDEMDELRFGELLGMV